MKELDRIDRKILRALQDDGRLTNIELAEKVALSPTATAERVKRLTREAYIEGYSARLSPAKLGRSLLVFVEVKLDRTTPDVFDAFARAVKRSEDVMECRRLRLPRQGACIRHGGLSRLPLRNHPVPARRAGNAHLCRHGGGQDDRPYPRLNELSLKRGQASPCRQPLLQAR
jgi:DNA-binding Lrp family transcriptional regulator